MLDCSLTLVESSQSLSARRSAQREGILVPIFVVESLGNGELVGQ